MNNDYSDIISLPRHVSKTHKQMSNSDRAAQFAPFAALTGFEQIIKEAARISKKRIILSNDQKEKINRTLVFLDENKDQHYHVKIIYFVPDSKKEGGEYYEISGAFIKIVKSTKKIYLEGDICISIKDIFDIEILDYYQIM